jgi:glycosyltransferase involved in cell wall biosynthesis
MMRDDPLISTIIPVYNGERYLAEAIESVLAQTYRNIEIIVVDDGSTDGSAEVAKYYGSPVQYYIQTNSGAGAARNRGIGLAQGNFLAFLDADDLWMPDKLELQMASFAGDQPMDMVFGHVRQFLCPTLTEEARKQIRIPVEIIPGHHAGAMLISKEAFSRVGLFGTEFQLVEFIDWHARAAEAGLKSLMLTDIVMNRRIHKTNQGVYKGEHRGEYARVLKAMLDRRRSVK